MSVSLKSRRVVDRRLWRSAALVLSLSLFATVLGIFPGISPTSPAHAAPGDPFSSDDPAVFVSKDQPTQLWRAVTSGNGEVVFEHEGNPAQVAYNALAYHPNSGYLIAVVYSDPQPNLPVGAIIRVGEEGRIQRLGNNTISRSTGGSMNGSGTTLIATNNAASRYWRVTASNGAVHSEDHRVNSSGERIEFQGHDLTYASGYHWSVATNGVLWRGNSATGLYESTGWNIGTMGTFGSLWTFGNGNIGVQKNNDGATYQIRFENPGASNPANVIPKIVAVSSGPTSANNDGTAIPGKPTDLGIQKSVPASHVPGEQVFFELEVTNYGPRKSGGWTVTDPLPAGLISPELTRDHHASYDSATGKFTISGGTLDVNETATITYTVDSQLSGQCGTNTATVIGNEADNNSSNDTDFAETCATKLEVEKTSDATEDTRVGDTVTYTVSATNTGNGDYTEEDPAVIIDDLSSVLDDAEYNADGAANQPGYVTFDERLLVWSGGLLAGETVDS